LLLSALAATFTGCGIDQSAPTGVTGSLINGRIVGGQQPIQGAAIYLYQVGTTGNGTGAQILNSPVSTLADGSFSLTGDYRCPASNTQVYLVAAGGNPGLSSNTNNTASVLMVALGDCGNLTASSFIFVNEVTTAAAAWALSPFLGPNAIVGSSATNANGLRNAFLVANNLVNTTTGQAGGTLPSGATLEASKLYSLANTLAACVNTAGGSACSPLFSAATENAIVPSNTLDAALNIVRNPAAKVSNVYDATTSSPPFPSGLSSPPHDWSMSITYTGGGIASPTGVAVDSTGAVWVANYFGGVASKFSAAGVPASATGYADPALEENFSVAIDTQDSAWLTNEQSVYATNTGYGSVTKFSSGGSLLSGRGFTSTIYFPYAIAADSNGEMWVADYGHSQASLLDLSGNSLIGPSGYSSSQLPLPLGVAIDGSHNAWFAGQSSVDKVTPGGTITEYVCCSSASALAIDQQGDVWASDYRGSAIVELSSSGVVQQTLQSGGVDHPEYIAIDGAGSAWAVNFQGDSVSGFSSATGGAASTALSPSYGLGLDAGLAEPFGIAADASGNLWVTSFANSTLTQFVGLVAPIKTPLLGPPQQP
jgi:streptogramin lyase